MTTPCPACGRTRRSLKRKPTHKQMLARVARAKEFVKAGEPVKLVCRRLRLGLAVYYRYLEELEDERRWVASQADKAPILEHQEILSLPKGVK